ncbi:hypothetical protein TEA_006276 [Camellia sinensis var. sinensis]|uniref:AT-hook motif nuclear-localized protein n=1 Tax=Camellia sinensis var. sinensis TaxID=542762 RepID=A0A4S4E287_CAMSN|nr:hypothetical protein TEA_006276 [Camellia sinensis var. sinensis]
MENNNITQNPTVEVAAAAAEITAEEVAVTGSGADEYAAVNGGVEGQVTVRRKRGRPRKHEVEENSPLPISPDFLASPVRITLKRGRGRPRGTGKLKKLASLGGVAVDTTGRDFTPHVGCFELLTLTGSPAFNEVGGVRRKIGMLSVSLAKPDGTVFGGAVAGSLIAAGPVQLIIASFKQIIKKQLLKRHSAESSTANGMPGGDLDTVRVLRSQGKTKSVEENGVATHPSRFPELPSGTRNNIGDQNDNLVFDQEASQPSEHMSDESMFDINDSVIEID